MLFCKLISSSGENESVRCDHMFMRILYTSTTHRIDNKFELLLDTVFGIILHIMLLGTVCDFCTICCTIKF